MKFIHSVPALIMEHSLIAGDLHIGIEEKLAQEGVHFPGSTHRLVEKLIKAFAANKARRLILLGDIKEAIGYPSKSQYIELQRFFFGIRALNTVIAKGNHDAHLEELTRRMGYAIEIKREFRLGEVTFLHGN